MSGTPRTSRVVSGSVGLLAVLLGLVIAVVALGLLLRPPYPPCEPGVVDDVTCGGLALWQEVALSVCAAGVLTIGAVLARRRP